MPKVRRVAAVVLFLVLALRAVVPALPMYVCTGMGTVHLDHPCCAGDPDLARPAWTAGCCQPEQGATVDAALPPGKSALVGVHQAMLAAPALALVSVPRLAPGRLLMARAAPWPIGPPPPLRSILRI